MTNSPQHLHGTLQTTPTWYYIFPHTMPVLFVWNMLNHCQSKSQMNVWNSSRQSCTSYRSHMYMYMSEDVLTTSLVKKPDKCLSYSHHVAVLNLTVRFKFTWLDPWSINQFCQHPRSLPLNLFHRMPTNENSISTICLYPSRNPTLTFIHSCLPHSSPVQGYLFPAQSYSVK